MGWNQENKGQTKRWKCAEPSWVSHQKFKSSFQSPWDAIIQHRRGNSSAGKSFRFTRIPTNASQHLPEPWTTSSVQLIEINLLDDILEIMSWPHLFNYSTASNSSSSVISSLYFSIATIYPADLFHCKLMLIRRSQNGTGPRTTSFVIPPMPWQILKSSRTRVNAIMWTVNLWDMYMDCMSWNIYSMWTTWLRTLK